jgi:hypothetical protein
VITTRRPLLIAGARRRIGIRGTFFRVRRTDLEARERDKYESAVRRYCFWDITDGTVPPLRHTGAEGKISNVRTLFAEQLAA